MKRPAESTAWDELVTTALVGTDRRPFLGLAALDDLVSGTATADLLSAAAVLWAYQEAGRLVAPGPGAIGEPAGSDTRPVLRPGALRGLSAIVDDRRLRPLLGEWLQLAAVSGRRLPGELAPGLLEAVKGDQRQPAVVVLGPLARWLGARNPRWTWATELDPLQTAARDTAVHDPAARDSVDDDVIAILEAATPAALTTVIEARPGPWSARLSKAALSGLDQLIGRSDLANLIPVRDALPRLALVIDPAFALALPSLDEALDHVAEKDRRRLQGFWSTRLTAFAAVLHFRHSLHEEFS